MHALYMDPAVAVQPDLQWHLVFKPHASFNSAKVDSEVVIYVQFSCHLVKNRSHKTSFST